MKKEDVWKSGTSYGIFTKPKINATNSNKQSMLAKPDRCA